MILLTLNAGSSTLKYTFFDAERGQVREIFRGTLSPQTGTEALADVLSEAARRGLPRPGLVGHRMVHGGTSFTRPLRLDTEVLARLEELVPLAPLHLPANIALARSALAQLPGARHVACFDTAFHRHLPDVARRFALPEALERQGVVRYGFHGLSYEYVMHALGTPAPERVIVAHLGSGASLAAVHAGRCVDTSMGMTPAGGIPMATRSGDLDPGILLYLMRERGLTLPELEQLVFRDSGFKAIGGSADMATLIARAEQGDGAAARAIELFCYGVRKQIGAYAAALGGLDCLVFSGGIGENSPRIRQLTCRGLEWVGILLDSSHNAENASIISTEASRVRVRVVATDENSVIARAAYDLQREDGGRADSKG